MGLTQQPTKVWEIPEPVPFLPEPTPAEEPATTEEPARTEEPVEVPA